MSSLINSNTRVNSIRPDLNKQVFEDFRFSGEKNTKKKFNKNTAGAVIGSVAGIAAGVACVYNQAKKGNSALKLKDLAYEEKDVLIMGAGSVLGGLAGGIITDDKKEVKPKLREASQQFFGCLAAPLGLLALGNKILDKNNITKAIPKAVAALTAIFGGMELGNKVMNKVNNKIFKEDVKYNVKPSDYLLHADDLCLTANMVLKDVKSLSAVTSRILPATLVLAGYHTGTESSGEDGSSHSHC